jgi:hypothetical protein
LSFVGSGTVVLFSFTGLGYWGIGVICPGVVVCLLAPAGGVLLGFP